MQSSLPLTTLLSQILVAFTIEFDNEAEHQLPHRTTLHGVSADRALHAPWLVSMAMGFNCLQHLGGGPIPLSELESRARTPTNLRGMQRWGYIVVTNESSTGSRLRPQPRRSTSVVRATAAGQAAHQIWESLPDVIEKRWRKRFGSIEIDALINAAKPIVRQLDPQLPDCMPILGYGLRTHFSNKKVSRTAPESTQPGPAAIDNLHLPSLVSRLLLAMAIEFESESPVSLAICADVIRVLNDEGVRVRDLPRFSGVSKEANAMAMGFLRKMKLVVVEKGSGKSPWQITRLTEAGAAVQERYPKLLAKIEGNWQTRFAHQAVQQLRQAAEAIARDADDPNSLLMKSIEPYPDGWRAAVAKPHTLPHFPMVLHRGGYPDGS